MVGQISTKPLRVLLIGNNPIDLGLVYDSLQKSIKRQFRSDTLFDLKRLSKKLKSYQPNVILIDDNMEKKKLSDLLQYLSNSGISKNIPITLLKNSNKDDMPRDGADEFILKSNLSTDSLVKSIDNSLRVHEFRSQLKKAYKKRKTSLGFS